MAIENTKLTPEQFKQLRALLDLERGLTEGQVEFIEGLSHLNRELLPHEAEKLARVHRGQFKRRRAVK